MAARFCPYCGRPVAPNGSFCSSCGASVSGAPPPEAPPGNPPPLTFASPPPYSPYAPFPSAYPRPGAGPAGSMGGDRVALSNVSLAAILGLVPALLWIVTVFLTPAFQVFDVTTTGGSGNSVSIDLTALEALMALGVLGFVFVLLELWFYREAFHTLSLQDERFSSPATGTLVAFVALLVLGVAVIALVGLIYQAVVCAGSGNPITSACLNVPAGLGLVALMGIAGLILFIGYIGFLIGVWRLGTRYGEGMFKAAAILLIFPLFNIVGLILVLVAARSVRGRSGSAMPGLTFH